MRRRARHVALQWLSSDAAVARGLAVVLASRAMGCDTGSIRRRHETKHIPPHTGGGGGGGFDFDRLLPHPDVAIGTAKVCLPPELRTSALPERVRLAEYSSKANTKPKQKRPRARSSTPTQHFFGGRDAQSRH